MIDLYFPQSVMVKHPVYNSGTPFDLDIQTATIMDRLPDCKVGHFGYNFFFRPRKAQNPKFTGYKTTQALKSAVTQCLKYHGFIVLSYFNNAI